MSKIGKTAIKWAEFEKRVPAEQKAHFFAFKGKHDTYMRRVLSNPAELPKIDWAAYKKVVPIPGLVEKFEKEYTGVKIPYPEDKLSAEVDKQWSSLKGDVDRYVKEQDVIIQDAEKELARIKKLPRYEDMTMEMVADMFPDIAIDSVKRPSFWPHTPEEQPGYVDKNLKDDHH